MLRPRQDKNPHPEAMRQPQALSTGLPGESVGLAWNIGRDSFWHGGGTYGQRAFLLVCPTRGIGLSGLTNAPVGGEVAAQASRWVLERFLGIGQMQTPLINVGGDTLDSCVGMYRHSLEDVELGRLGEALVARQIPKGGFPTTHTPPQLGAMPVIRFGFYADDRLVGLDPPFTGMRAELIRGPNGDIDWLRFGGRIRRRVR